MSSIIREAKNTRPKVRPEEVAAAVDVVVTRLYERLEQYGYGTYASRHEVLGILAEEFKELTDATHASPLSGAPADRRVKGKYEERFLATGETVRQELVDIAVAAIFSVACLDARTLAW
jgi:hypothetical protein